MTNRQEVKAWTVLAIGALAIAGVFALLLVFSRTPYIQDFLPWPWKSFFHKGLVTHVIFSFVVWFLATMGAVFSFVFAQTEGLDEHSGVGKYALGLAYLGCLGLILPALMGEGEAELNNYVPVLNHWLYYVGLSFLFGAITLISIRQIVTRIDLSTSLTALIFLLAVACFVFAYFVMPEEIAVPTYNEHLFWGGGHVLQFVNTALLLLVWIWVVRDQFNEQLLAKQYERLAFGLLLAFALPGGAIYFTHEFLSQSYRDFYTDQLRYGLPISATIGSLALFFLLVSKKASSLDNLTKHALWLSLITFNLGGVYGIFLDGSDTRVPAHYHAVIGGINLAMMIFYHRVILPFIKAPVYEGKLLFAQYWLYGLGQIMHASGMYLAGSQGVPRKTAGDAQALDNLEKILSMGLMGIGGIIAVIGGVLFVIMTLRWIIKGGQLYEAN